MNEAQRLKTHEQFFTVVDRATCPKAIPFLGTVNLIKSFLRPGPPAIMGGIMKRLGVLLLAICRTVYCWMFLIWSLGSVYVVSIGIRHLGPTRLFDKGAIATSTIFTIYSVVFGIAWWMIVRGKPALKRWAIAANLIYIFFYFPVVFWDWRGVLKNELNSWPVVLIGIFGIIIFSIPYHGWRRDHLDEVVRSTSRTR